MNRIKGWILFKRMLAQEDARVIDHWGPDLHQDEISVIKVLIIPEGGKACVTEVLHIKVFALVPPLILAQEIRKLNA